MHIYQWKSLTDSERKELLARPIGAQSPELKARVAAILEAVRREGDQALIRFSELYDHCRLQKFQVAKEELEEAWRRLDDPTRKALTAAFKNIHLFHSEHRQSRTETWTRTGVRCFYETRPLEKIGLYVPGGSAPLVSSVLMMGVPSLIAGNPRRILCTPPQSDGRIDPYIAAAAHLCGISEVYRVGGAQAIAAMAYGTESIPQTDKIFGPGNAWVTEAKKQVASDPDLASIDMPAGPSELLLIVDAAANPRFAAADLLSQAEHGPDSQVILLSTDADMAVQVLQEVETQLALLPRRDIASAALRQSRCFLTESLEESFAIANAYAPEHLILQIENAEHFLPRIQHAGSVFIGPWSPESAGDYASGPNHVLPTFGQARFLGALGVEAFEKRISFQELTREGLLDLAPTIDILAGIEGLEAHRRAVQIRLEGLL